MTFKKTAETLPHGAHTLERDYYVNPDILQKAVSYTHLTLPTKA